MKKAITLLLMAVSTATLFSCHNDTSTQIPDSSGYKPRSDSAMPGNLDEKPSGAVAIDSVKNGQVNVNGASMSDSTAKGDSTQK